MQYYAVDNKIANNTLNENYSNAFKVLILISIKYTYANVLTS